MPTVIQISRGYDLPIGIFFHRASGFSLSALWASSKFYNRTRPKVLLESIPYKVNGSDHYYYHCIP